MTERHEERHGPNCGGEWIGGVCVNCQTVCQCGLCHDTWDAACERIVIACERMPVDRAPEPDPIYNRLVKRLQMAAATYRLARDKLPYPTEDK